MRAQVLARLSDAHYYLGNTGSRGATSWCTTPSRWRAESTMPSRSPRRSLPRSTPTGTPEGTSPGSNWPTKARRGQRTARRPPDRSTRTHLALGGPPRPLPRLEEADEDIARFGRSTTLGQPAAAVHAAALRAMRALLDGRWDEGGEQAASEASDSASALALSTRSSPTGQADASAPKRAAPPRRAHLPLRDLLVREVAAIPAWRAALAWAYVQGGRTDLARSEIAYLVSDDLGDAPTRRKPDSRLCDPRARRRRTRRRRSRRSHRTDPAPERPVLGRARLRPSDARPRRVLTRARERVSRAVGLSRRRLRGRARPERPACARGPTSRTHRFGSRASCDNDRHEGTGDGQTSSKARGTHIARELSMARLLRDAPSQRSSS